MEIVSLWAYSETLHVTATSVRLMRVSELFCVCAPRFHFAHVIERFLAQQKKWRTIRNTSMNSRLCFPTRLKCLIADEVYERNRLCGTSDCVGTRKLQFLKLHYFPSICFQFIFSTSLLRHRLLFLMRRFYFHLRFAENEQFRFNVSNLFPRWPLKVRRTMLCMMWSGSIQFLSSTREMASSPQTRSMPRYVLVFICVSVCVKTMTTATMGDAHASPRPPSRWSCCGVFIFFSLFYLKQ